MPAGMTGGSNKASKGGTGNKKSGGNSGSKSSPSSKKTYSGPKGTPAGLNTAARFANAPSVKFSSLKSPIGTPKTNAKPSYGRGEPWGGMNILGIDRAPATSPKTYTSTPNVKFSDLPTSGSYKDQSRLAQATKPKDQGRIQQRMAVSGGYGVSPYEGGAVKRTKDQSRIMPGAIASNYGTYRSPPGSGIAKPAPTGIAARTVFPGSNAPKDRVLSTELAFGPQSTMPQRPISRTPQRQLVATASPSMGMPRRPVSVSPSRNMESTSGLPSIEGVPGYGQPSSPLAGVPGMHPRSIPARQLVNTTPGAPQMASPYQARPQGPATTRPVGSGSNFYTADFADPSPMQRIANIPGRMANKAQRGFAKADQFLGGLGFGGNGFGGGNPGAPFGSNHGANPALQYLQDPVKPWSGSSGAATTHGPTAATPYTNDPPRPTSGAPAGQANPWTGNTVQNGGGGYGGTGGDLGGGPQQGNAAQQQAASIGAATANPATAAQQVALNYQVPSWVYPLYSQMWAMNNQNPIR